MADKVLLLVGDSLRNDTLRNIKGFKDVKPLLPAYPQTSGATFSLSFGLHASEVFWPGEYDPYKEVIGNISRDVIDPTSLSIFYFFRKSAEMMRDSSVAHAMRKVGVRPVLLRQIDVAFGTSGFDELHPGNMLISKAFAKVLHELIRIIRHKDEPFTHSVLFNYFVRMLGPLGKELGKGLPDVHVDFIGDKLIKFLKDLGRDNRKLFVYAHLFTPHAPYMCRFMFNLKYVVAHMYLSWLFRPYKIDEVEWWFKERCKQIRDAILNNEVLKEAYREYLRCNEALARFAERLAEELVPEGWSILLTGDHPEFFGESCMISHPRVPPLEEVRVPFRVAGMEKPEINAYTQIPEVAAKELGVPWEAPSRDDVVSSIVTMEPNYMAIMVATYEKGRGLIYLYDTEGKEVWIGNENLRDKIKEHLENARKIRKKWILRLKIRSKLVGGRAK